MNKLFNMNSPLMRKLSQLPDLILLNLLWIFCSLPVITAGAATTALHTVVQAYVSETDSGIIKPFFAAFRKNFKQSTLLWLPVMLLLALLLADLLFLMEKAEGAQLLLWIPFLIIGAIVSIVISYAFPLIARYENDTKTIISNSFLLFSLHLFPSLAVIAMNILPWGLLLLWPELFLKTCALWLIFGAALISYIATHIMLPIFKQYESKE